MCLEECYAALVFKRFADYAVVILLLAVIWSLELVHLMPNMFKICDEYVPFHIFNSLTFPVTTGLSSGAVTTSEQWVFQYFVASGDIPKYSWQNLRLTRNKKRHM